MTIAQFVAEHDVREIVHFTQSRGLLGFSFTGAALPRGMLAKEYLLRYIVKHNAGWRKDEAWFGHVNLSINQINRRFFASSESWHEATKSVWWAILSFDPVILSHDNVFFATTNNAYPGVRRAPGLAGLQALYAEPIDHGYASWPNHMRSRNAVAGDPTCPQAEVLYPGRLEASFLRKVYVRNDKTYREACSFLTFLPNWRDIEVSVEPDRFKPFKVDPCRGH